jgi:hypothetical protein
MLAVGIAVATEGCSRHFYRKRADEDVSEILAQKDKYPDWAIENWHVYPDPRARFADPSDPDHPPMPPDDPAAYCLSPNPQKPRKVGIERIEGNGYLELLAQWDQENRTKKAQEDETDHESIEPPAPPVTVPPTGSGEALAATHPDVIQQVKSRSSLDLSGRPAYLITLDQAAEMAMFNSREFQDQREELYLAALPVAQERFSFMGQTFIASEFIRSYAGDNAPGGPANNWTINNGIGVAKVLPTSALLLFSAANQTVFDFLNPKKTLNTTSINFEAFQPLLQGGGAAVALESLTDAERNLLYAIRNYARFRKSLYVEIASNNGGAISGSAFQPSGVVASTSSLPTAALGDSGLHPGIPPVVSTALNGIIVAPSSPGFINLARAITPTPSGYLNTMLQTIQVYIDEENIDVLSTILQRFRGLLEGDLVQPLQVQSVEQQLLTGRYQLITDQQNVPQALNSFKLELGLPMQLSIQVDDSELRPLVNQFHRARAIIEDEQSAVSQASDLIAIEKAPSLRDELAGVAEKSRLVRGTTFAKRIRERLKSWHQLNDKQMNDRLKELHDEQQKLLDREAELQHEGKYLSPTEEARLKEAGAEYDLGSFEKSLRYYESKYVENGKPKKPADQAGERQRRRDFQDVVYGLQKVFVEARDERWTAVQSTWPELPRCCVDGVDLIKDDLTTSQKAAAEHALNSRLDLMNTRGIVVDTWRQLAIFANALLGIFNVQYQLNAAVTVGGGQAGNIGPTDTAHQLLLNTQPPLVRITQRDNYRAAQIAYQRSRRALQEAEDLAVEAVDNELTNLRQFAEQYKIQQRQLELAYKTIDSSLESLSAPTAPQLPPGLPARGAVDGPAGLTTQLLSSQRTLPTTQTALLTIWINFLDQRLQLYRDLELMPLDARGVWIDKIKECECDLGLAPVENGMTGQAGDKKVAPPALLPPLGNGGK